MDKRRRDAACRYFGHRAFVDPPTAEEYLELQKKYERILEENDRLRNALIRMHDMYDAYYKKEKEV